MPWPWMREEDPLFYYAPTDCTSSLMKLFPALQHQLATWQKDRYGRDNI